MMNSKTIFLFTSVFIVHLAISIFVLRVGADSASWPIDVGLNRTNLTPFVEGSKQYRYYEFNVSYLNKSVNCKWKLIPAVNGQFPGPTIYANQGDRIVVKLINNIQENITIHFHGIRQMNSAWMDGAAYITMCPLKPGANFVYDFKVLEESGTFLWHAHIKSLRATVHGAIVIYPNDPYPFLPPAAEFEVILAEWWHANVTELELASREEGKPLVDSDGFLINGRVGSNIQCSETLTDVGSVLDVVAGRTYLVRVINAGMDAELFFSIGGQTMTVVEADGSYVKMFQTSFLFLTPGQTFNVLVTARSDGTRLTSTSKSFYMSVVQYRYLDVVVVPFEPVAAFRVLPKFISPAMLPWNWSPQISRSIFSPLYRDTNASTGQVFSFAGSLKNQYSGRVPLTVDRNITIVVGVRYRECHPEDDCSVLPRGVMNNFTFDLPQIALLEADYYGYRAPIIKPQVRAVFNDSFPDHPPVVYDFTAKPPGSSRISRLSNGGTEVLRLKLNTTVDIILQGSVPFENHPFHLHGHNFYVLGQGGGNFDYSMDPINFNLEDPPLRNTVGIPYRGWVAIRFTADNPGMWLFHCHLDMHILEGMEMVFLVDSDYGPPPTDLPPC